MAWGLDTNSFLNTFTRNTSRPGVPKEIICDNGTNFVGAVNELKELVGQLDKYKIQERLHREERNGLLTPQELLILVEHKVMVKAFKKAIYVVLSSSDVPGKELITVVSSAESLLNSRPLTYQSVNIKDDVP